MGSGLVFVMPRGIYFQSKGWCNSISVATLLVVCSASTSFTWQRCFVLFPNSSGFYLKLMQFSSWQLRLLYFPRLRQCEAPGGFNFQAIFPRAKCFSILASIHPSTVAFQFASCSNEVCAVVLVDDTWVATPHNESAHFSWLWLRVYQLCSLMFTALTNRYVKRHYNLTRMGLQVNQIAFLGDPLPVGGLCFWIFGSSVSKFDTIWLDFTKPIFLTSNPVLLFEHVSHVFCAFV